MASVLPSVDRVLQMSAVQALGAQYSHTAVVHAIRSLLSEMRQAMLEGAALPAEARQALSLTRHLQARLEAAFQPSLRRVFNLTGTVLHTNLGRALLPAEAVEAVQAVMTQSCNLEYDLAPGARGDRDTHVEGLLAELTGAEDATVVNNNAAAVLLVLATLATRKEVIVSRGEVIEIGGSFRMPEIMARAGCRLREVGTTNRTHLADFEQAIGARSALLMKVHASNYAIQGFTATVPEKELAALAHARGLPFVVDLGSGALVDLSQYGLPKEPAPQDTLAHGADLVTFSGDKLLGGPQAGIIVGRTELVKTIKRNHLKRALRVDKMTLAALEAVLKLYRQPEKLAQRLPTLRLLTRPAADIEALCRRVEPAVLQAVRNAAQVSVVPCHSQIGSGALPVELLPSTALALTPLKRGRGEGTALRQLATAFRALPVPVIGIISDGALKFDLRCLENEREFVAQLVQLQLDAKG
ncbi:MAG: L-seryl-tRNA(Sec) selenium transferase [Nitrospirae bacterium]|nr:MAG: L-seryl-tRNA(Sec) selenium transferase [Nitrospirota bacterium]